jgi:hypothetical protein
MTRTEMDPQLAREIRAELAAIGTKHSRLQRHQRRVRALTVGVGVLAIVGATTAAAVVVSNIPGSTTVVPLGGISTATHTGTGTMDLGPAPAKVGAVILNVTCLNRQGTVSIETNPQNRGSSGDFVTIYCSGRTTPVHIKDGLLPKPGSTTITITADPGTRWKATAEYASSSTSAWGVNAHGQTYGLCNYKGCPNLMAAQELAHGEEGYIYSKEMDAFRGAGYLMVYKSDGTTVIGRFAIGIPDDGNHQ